MIDNIKKLASIIATFALIFSACKIYFNMDEDIHQLKDTQTDITHRIAKIGPNLANKFEKARCRDALTLLNMSLSYPDFIPMDKRDKAIEKMFEKGHGAQLKDLDLTCNSCDRKILAQFISPQAVHHHCPRFGITYARNKTTKIQRQILFSMNEELRKPL